MTKKYIGIIGGSGFYNMEGFEAGEERVLKTPFGNPSDSIVLGRLNGIPIAFIPRHGRGHLVNPTELNYRANIYALKSLGVDKILAVSAVGSMKEDLHPGHIVVVDQLIDRTRSRPSTFFENGIVAHVGFADPFCQKLSQIFFEAGLKAGAKVQKGGTYVCIEGPMFSTRAESKLFRSWGVDVIGMTAYQEAKLAREAEICYATIAMVTDYDCWHESEADVTAEAVVAVMKKNVAVAQAVIRESLPKVAGLDSNCTCNQCLKHAIIRDVKLISAETKKRLAPIIGRYLV